MTNFITLEHSHDYCEKCNSRIGGNVCSDCFRKRMELISQTERKIRNESQSHYQRRSDYFGSGTFAAIHHRPFSP